MSNKTATAPSRPSKESLHVQLTELNNRSRWYSSELWQVPFAYLGLSGLVIGQVADKASRYLSLAFGASAVFGIFVIVHMHRLRGSERRAVKNLQDTERALNLEVTARARKGPKILQVAVFLAVLAYAALAFICLYRAYSRRTNKA